MNSFLNFTNISYFTPQFLQSHESISAYLPYVLSFSMTLGSSLLILVQYLITFDQFHQLEGKKKFFDIWPFPFKEWTSPPIHIEVQVPFHSSLSQLKIRSRTSKFGFLHVFYSFFIRLPQISASMPLSLIIDNFCQNRLPEPWHFFGQTRPELNIQLATAVAASLSTFRRLFDESKVKFFAAQFPQFLNKLKTLAF